MSGTLCIHSKRYISLVHTHFKNYYDALGITPKATQADIKSAYYKLSMQYHPDRNQGCKESAVKFQTIKAAYEVLSDYNARKLYDRGLYVDRGVGPSSPSDFQNPTGTSAGVQKTRPVMTGQSPIYNYDEWSRAHYGGSFSRKAEAKAKRESYQRFQEHANSVDAVNNVGFSIGIFLFIVLVLSATYESNDTPVYKDKPTQR